MSVTVPTASIWENVVELTKISQEKGNDPFHWAIQLSTSLSISGVSLPSSELAQVLVSHICWGNNVPMAWKYLEKALMANLAPPMLVLASLSTRVTPSRRLQPEAYRIYLELLKRHAFSFRTQIKGPCCQKILMTVDEALNLSQTFGIQACELGVVVVEFVFAIVWQLLDATLEDEGLQEVGPQKKFGWTMRQQDVQIDGGDNVNEKRALHCEKLRKENTMMAIELIGQFLQHKVTSRLLNLACQNMPLHWEGFVQRLLQLQANSSVLRSSKISPATLILSSYTYTNYWQEFHPNQLRATRAIISSGSLASSVGNCHGAGQSAMWIPLDLFMEDAMDGSQVAATCAIEIVSDLTKSLQALNGTTWHETFLGLWMSSLRLVQRERDPIEGPVPLLDARLCMLLSITTLAIANIIEEEEVLLINETERSQRKEKSVVGKRRKDLASSVQVLGNFEGLLAPPQSVVSVANQAAMKAVMFVSGLAVGSGYMESTSMIDMPINCGNMWHLIVEACIARKLLDTSVYFWPGYVSGHVNKFPHNVPSQVPGWHALVKGAPLSTSMINALMTAPASCLAELEKIYEIATNGSDAEKISAATILCGASLIRGWNIQEHTVRFIVRLLSSPINIDHAGSDSHLIDNAPILYSVLTGISSVDSVHVFSLQGMVPELACTLMAICEVFGSCFPTTSWSLPTGEEITVHMVFSAAFILLLRLWKFNYPPLEHCARGKGAPPVGSQLAPEYLLLLRNTQVQSPRNILNDRKNSGQHSTTVDSPTMHPIFVDSFPKLKIWYRQHQACIASTLSGLVHGTPVHQIVDALLDKMFWKMNKGSQCVAQSSANSSVSNSSSSGSEDTCQRLKLPAWDILEAVPFVVDAALTACSHGRFSPRELATGLKDLADFLPASLATMVSYFSAEVTRGVWKPVFMNGTDWPSPAANLSTVEAELKKILAASGVDVPSLVAAGSSAATLPLPLAAFVSLTITYKPDKVSERLLNLAGPALENLAAGCPWPSQPIAAALWAQKVKRWSDYLIFSASRTIFQQSNFAVVQLLKNCFAAFVGLSGPPISTNGGVGCLLGHGFRSQFCPGLCAVAPGILYLRIHRCIRDIVFVTEQILSTLIVTLKEIAGSEAQRERTEKLKKARYGMKYGQVSLAALMTHAKQAASLGASLLWLSGGAGMVQTLFQEALPSWFLSDHGFEPERGRQETVAMLGGYGLAYFSILCGMFAWGVSSVGVSRRRQRIIGGHMEFMTGTLEGKISLSCDWATWRAYVSGFVGLMVVCAPEWVGEIEVDILKRLSRGLRLLNEEELALALLGRGGVGAMGAAAELLIGSLS